MNLSYFRIKTNAGEAIKRLCTWLASDYKEKIETNYGGAVKVSVNENGQWKGSCVYVYENDGWTVFEDLSGGFSFIEAAAWKEFAGKDPFVFAAYNDAMIYAEMIVITDGNVTKKFIECFDLPEENINEGDGVTGIENWTDVAAFVDADDIIFSEEGTVYIF